MLRITSACVGLTALFGAAVAPAAVLEHIVYSPTSLPSAQGWQYALSDLDETDVYHALGAVLDMDTIGTPMDLGPPAIYAYATPEHPDARQAEVRLRLQVLASEFVASPGARQRFTFAAGPFRGLWLPLYVFNLDTSQVYLGAQPPRELDTTGWHDYVLRFDLDDAERFLTLSIDGQPIDFSLDGADGAVNGAVTFGDGSASGNAHVLISEIEITLSSPDVPTEATSLSTVKTLFFR